MTKALPPNVHSTRSAHFRTLLGSGGYVVTGAVFALIAFTIGAAKHSAGVMIGGPLAVIAAGAVIAWVTASNDAEKEFFNRFAAAHGLNLWPQWSLNAFTPLLGAGDRRHCEHWMEADGRSLGWYTYEVKHQDGRDGSSYTKHDFTLAMVDVGEQGMSRFQGIYLRQRRGLFDHLNSDADWLRGHSLKPVELESAKFCERYELCVDRDQDDLTVRQLFSPSLVVWLADHPLQPGFELRAGQLVVFIPGHCGEAGRLEFLLMAANEISKRIQAELTEAAQAGSL